MTEPTQADHDLPQDDIVELAEPEQRGSLHIAEKVLERIATQSAREVDGVAPTTGAGLRALVSSRLPRASVRTAGGQTRVSVDIAARWPEPAWDVAADVRAQVQSNVLAMTGRDVRAVDVSVHDVVHVAASERRVR